MRPTLYTRGAVNRTQNRAAILDKRWRCFWFKNLVSVFFCSPYILATPIHRTRTGARSWYTDTVW